MKFNGLQVFILSLDYGDRFDILKLDLKVFSIKVLLQLLQLQMVDYLQAGSLANVLNLFKAGTYTGPAASKSLLYKTWSTATAQDYENWGTADLDLRINNKSSAAFGQVTIPMADQWNITLGARYTYDVKRNDLYHWFKFSRCTFSD